MILTLKLRFRTTFGQSLHVMGNHPQLGGSNAAQAIPLQYLDEEFWQVTLAIPPHAPRPKDGVVYNYILRQPDGSTITDHGSDHVLSPELFNEENVLILDAWNEAGFSGNAFYTEPFTEVLLRQNRTEAVQAAPAPLTHTFKVKAPLLARGQTLALLGSADALGRWDTAKALLLTRPSGKNHFSLSPELGGAARWTGI